MRSTSLLLAVAIGLTLLAPFARADDAVGWTTDLTQAKQLAAQTNRLVLVHFWAPWCKPCRKMDTTVFADKALGPTLSQQYVMVKLNLDNNKGLAMRYGVKSIPADVVITPSGELLKQTTSPRTASTYVSAFQVVAASYNPAPQTRMASSSVASDVGQARPQQYSSYPPYAGQANSGYGAQANGATTPPAANQAPPIPGYQSQVQSQDGNRTGDRYALRDNIPYRERVPDPYLPERTALDDPEAYHATASNFKPPAQDVRDSYDHNQFSRNDATAGQAASATGVQIDTQRPGFLRNEFVTQGSAQSQQPKNVFPARNGAQGNIVQNPAATGSTERYSAGQPAASDSSGGRYGDIASSAPMVPPAPSSNPPWSTDVLKNTAQPGTTPQQGSTPDRYADRYAGLTGQANSRFETPPNAATSADDRYADYWNQQGNPAAPNLGVPTGSAAQANPNAVHQPQVQAAPQIPAGNPPLAFQGYCVVTMMETLQQGGQWVPGNTAWGARHGGRTYLFATQDAQQKFLAEPERYAPLVSGIDIVHFLETNQVQDGNVQFGVFVDGRILLFASEDNLQKFSRAPDDYFNGLRQAQLENRLQIR